MKTNPLREELWAVIWRYDKESSINIGDVVSTLELIKFELLQEHYKNAKEGRYEKEED